jgi:hypothetical protein
MAEAAVIPPGTSGRFRLAAEAALWLLIAGFAVRILSFPQVAAVLSGPRRPRVTGSAADDAVRVAWAVAAAARRAPWPAACFERGLAAFAMLRLRGRSPVLFYGARSDGAAGPSAHVWVRLAGRDVTGGAEASRFAILARYPAADQPDGARRA